MDYKAFQSDIPKIEAKIGYTFRDKSLLTQAFTRTSFCNEHTHEGYQSNEVLEFFGDGVLSVAIISFLLESLTERYRYGIKTELREGDFSNIKSKLSDKTNLSRSLLSLGLQRYLLLGEGDRKLGIENEPSVMEDLFESIVGAVYIDSGKDLEKVTRVVSKMLDMSVYTEKRATKVAPKNALQEFCSAKSRRLPQPEYKTLEETGPDHKKVYVRGVYVGGRLIGRAEGKNQKAADARAAEIALELLMREEEAKASQKTTTEEKPKPKAKKGARGEEKKLPKENTAQAGITAKNQPTKKAPAQKPQKAGRKPETKTSATNREMAKSTVAAADTEKAKGAKSAGSTAENMPKIAHVTDHTARLKQYIQAKGKPSPAWRDLGINRNHNGVLEYRIECECSGKSTVGVGTSRIAAREMAAAAMLRALGSK